MPLEVYQAILSSKDITLQMADEYFVESIDMFLSMKKKHEYNHLKTDEERILFVNDTLEQLFGLMALPYLFALIAHPCSIDFRRVYDFVINKRLFFGSGYPCIKELQWWKDSKDAFAYIMSY